MSHTLSAAIPPALFLIGVVWLVVMRRLCQFNTINTIWPYRERPGLALELASSPKCVTTVLGPPDTDVGRNNRLAAILQQKLDFVFILLYVLFFIAVAFAITNSWQRTLPIAICAMATGLADVLENLAILRLTGPRPRGSAKIFGQSKWFLYFVTIGLEGSLLLPGVPTARAVAALVPAILLIGIALGGIMSSVKGSFNGIVTGAKLSLLGAFLLVLVPILGSLQFSWGTVASYLDLMRVPLLTAALLFALPFIAFKTGAKSLLRGLFDLTAPSIFIVTLTALAVSGTACMTASLVLAHACQRFGVDPLPLRWMPSAPVWLSIMFGLALPLIWSAVSFSTEQKHGFAKVAGAALAGALLALSLAGVLVTSHFTLAGWVASHTGLQTWLLQSQVFAGYVSDKLPEVFNDHARASDAFLVMLAIYIIVGIYGWSKLGKERTVPALCSALMMILLISWMLSASAFFFDKWHIPLLLLVGIAGTLTAQSQRSDHYYDLRPRNLAPSPDPAQTLLTPQTRANKQLIVVAANGGGIQAGAWAAQVLYGLLKDNGERFRNSLRCISSVSGGSVGTACFVHWLANPNDAVLPPAAAAASSIDEVAWGLAWPDLLRSLAPWFLGTLIGRGKALEKAWVLNGTQKTSENRDLLNCPLSDWNTRVSAGELPAVIMNATICESGQRLLLATTHLANDMTQPRARMDADTLHTVNGEPRDVAIVTAARLSASFTYVTPAARAQCPDPKPHVVDGGYYDNYGMATLVEWLDEALSGAGEKLESVLVIQIHGSPVTEDSKDATFPENRGWFYQAIAPLATLDAVRGAGQVAHNDIELNFLQRRWQEKGLPVHSVTFEFSERNAPLSWHLTPSEQTAIVNDWDKKMGECRAQVTKFLNGDNHDICKCPWCFKASHTQTIRLDTPALSPSHHV